MKKFIIIMITTLLLLLSSSSVYADLGDYVDGPFIESRLINGEYVLVSTIYWQFGVEIRFSNGDPSIIWLYGSPGGGFAKSSFNETIKNLSDSFDENVYIFVYEANDMANPNPIIQKLENRKNANIQNLNLEIGRLYIIVYRDEKGAVLKVKKISLSK